MEFSAFYLSCPWVYALIALVAGSFLAGSLLKRFALPFWIFAAVGLTVLIIVSLLHEATYLDVAFMALVCLLPPMGVFAFSRKAKKPKEGEKP